MNLATMKGAACDLLLRCKYITFVHNGRMMNTQTADLANRVGVWWQAIEYRCRMTGAEEGLLCDDEPFVRRS